MDRVDQVAAGIRRAGEIPLRVVRSSFPDIEDDTIELTDGFHVSVSDSYVMLVVPLADGTFSFFPPAESIGHLLHQLTEARAERNRPDAEAPPPTGEGSDGSDPGAAAVGTTLTFWNERFKHFPTREELVSAGATFHRSPVDGADYVLFATHPPPRTFAVLRFDTSGDAAPTAESITPTGAARLLTGYLDGTHQASADRFFAYLEKKEREVRPEVAATLRAAGYWVCTTGGGCMAWIRHLTHDGESHLLITAHDDRIDGDPNAEIWSVGRYDGDGYINLDTSHRLVDAIAVAEQLPPAIDPHGEIVQEVYETLDAARAALAPPSPDPGSG